MTNDKAIKTLNTLRESINGAFDYNCRKQCTALDMAAQALEKEPKTGHWIETAEEYYKAVNEKGGGVDENTPYFTDDIACSECLAKFNVIDNETERFICCPNCGAKMVQERNN